MEKQDYRASWQIAVHKTDKYLLELVDKLKPVPAEHYAHLHADGDKNENGWKATSLIGMVSQDYSAGTGDKLVRVSVNLSPNEGRVPIQPGTGCGKRRELHAGQDFW